MEDDKKTPNFIELIKEIIKPVEPTNSNGQPVRRPTWMYKNE